MPPYLSSAGRQKRGMVNCWLTQVAWPIDCTWSVQRQWLTPAPATTGFVTPISTGALVEARALESSILEVSVETRSARTVGERIACFGIEAHWEGNLERKVAHVKMNWSSHPSSVGRAADS